jgi:hypothetical protein
MNRRALGGIGARRRPRMSEGRRAILGLGNAAIRSDLRLARTLSPTQRIAARIGGPVGCPAGYGPYRVLGEIQRTSRSRAISSTSGWRDTQGRTAAMWVTPSDGVRVRRRAH